MRGIIKILACLMGILLIQDCYASLQESKAFDLEENTQGTERIIVFDNANSEIPYRIPAIAQALNGDIIAVTDYRYSKADIGMKENGRLDLRYRIKDHDTGDWGEIMTLIAAKGEGDEIVSFGDPCIVADREFDLVLVTSCCGNVSFPKGNHENHQGWARIISEDGGKTWSEFEDISDQIFNQLDKGSKGEIRCFFIGSGKILQSTKIKNDKYYRLYCAALVKTGDGTNVNYALYSDDFGKNWKVLGDVDEIPVPQGGDEPKVEELPNGNVLISSRTKGGRLYNIFDFSNIEKGEGKWGAAALSTSDVNGVIGSSNACNGEVLMIPVMDISKGEKTYLLLQSLPLGPNDRSHVGINYKVLDTPDKYNSPENIAKDWDGVFEVTDKSSAYSTMILNTNGKVSFLYEENSYNGGYDIVYDEFSVAEITNGRYQLSF